MNRDGTNLNFQNGGHRIKQDPLLIRAIEEIRDGYFDLFMQKATLMKNQDRSPNDATKTAIENIDYDLIIWNNTSYERLQLPNYGLSAETIDAIKNATQAVVPEMPCLSKKDAAKVTGTIIRRAINAFEITFARDGVKRPTVPHVPLTSMPEQTGRIRQSADVWTERSPQPDSPPSRS